MNTDTMFLHYKTIGEIQKEMANATNIEEALKNGLSIISSAFDVEYSVIWYYEKNKSKMLKPSYWTGSINLTNIDIKPGDGMVGKVFEDAKSINYLDYKSISPKPELQGFEGVDIKSTICVPLENDYENLGCIQFVNKHDGTLFNEDDAEVCAMFAMLLSIAIDKNDLLLGTFEQKPIIASLKNITKEFKNGGLITQVLKGVDLDIYKGEFLVILGESGCGKSTMLNILGGMDSPTSGSFSFMDADYANASEGTLTEFRRKHIGFIFQSYNLMPNMSARQNLQFIAELNDDSFSPDDALNWVGLADKANSYPSQLSGGQQQRVSIARALIKNPEFILADEPTAALDYATSIEVLQTLEENVARGISLVMVTHNEEISKMANRVIRMSNGVVSSITFNRHPVAAKELEW